MPKRIGITVNDCIVIAVGEQKTVVSTIVSACMLL